MSTQLLCLHAGATRVPRSALDALTTPPPTAKRRDADGNLIRPFTPIPHATLVQEVVDHLTASHITVTAEEHAIWGPDASRYFGLLHLSFPSVPPGVIGLADYEREHNVRLPLPDQPKDFSWLLGLRNAHDTSMSAGGVLGTRVFVCDNTAFSGDVSFRAAHTKNIASTFRSRVIESLGTLLSRRTQVDALYATMKTVPLDPRASAPTVHDLTIRLLDAGVLTTTSIQPVLTSFRAGYFKSLGVLADSDPSAVPNRPAVTEADRALDHTLWGYYNTVTDRLRALGPLEHARRTSRLTALMASECGSTLAEPEPSIEPAGVDVLA